MTGRLGWHRENVCSVPVDLQILKNPEALKYTSRKFGMMHLSLGNGIAHLEESLLDLGSEHKPVRVCHVKTLVSGGS